MPVLMIGDSRDQKTSRAREVLLARGLWAEIAYLELGSEEGRRLAAAHGHPAPPFYLLDGGIYFHTGEIMRRMEAGREAAGGKAGA